MIQRWRGPRSLAAHFANQFVGEEVEGEEGHACSAVTGGSMISTPKAALKMSMGPSLRSLPYKPCQACPDTGASCNVLNELEARRMKLQLKRSKVSLTNASGGEMKVVGECEVYTAALNGRTRKIRVIVSPDLVDNMLLGLQSQKFLGILHQSWPNAIVQAQRNQVK